jgi:hypothetical protein
MKRFIIGLLLLPTLALALEVDEKLTARIVKTSETRKTLMINRGTEDGLVEGDHAKFVVTAGIVARAVCVRVSPTRSVWSVYRLVNADFIQNDSVMTLKITPPVKITKDETQAIVRDDTPSRASGDPAELGIPLADGAQDLGPGEENSAEMKSLMDIETASSLVEKNIEVFGILNISGLTAASKTETGEKSFNNAFSYHHIGLGGEYYSRREREWYSRFSIQVMLNLMRLSSQAYNGSSSTNDVTEFGGALNWHPGAMPSGSYQFIPYFQLGASMGSVKSTYTPGTENTGGSELTANGTTMSFSLGFGYKFYTVRGFGARIMLDYYLRSERFKEDDLTNIHNRTISGPRLMLGISYRF